MPAACLSECRCTTPGLWIAALGGSFWLLQICLQACNSGMSIVVHFSLPILVDVLAAVELLLSAKLAIRYIQNNVLASQLRFWESSGLQIISLYSQMCLYCWGKKSFLRCRYGLRSRPSLLIRIWIPESFTDQKKIFYRKNRSRISFDTLLLRYVNFFTSAWSRSNRTRSSSLICFLKSKYKKL